MFSSDLFRTILVRYGSRLQGPMLCQTLPPGNSLNSVDIAMKKLNDHNLYNQLDFSAV